MWNQVGRPSILEGKIFFPLHGTPIPCRARSRTRLADWLPEPFTVPTRMARSLIEGGGGENPFEVGSAWATGIVVDMRCLAKWAARSQSPLHPGSTYPNVGGDGGDR